MNAQQHDDNFDKVDTVIVGLGTTGLSVARYLSNQDKDYAVVDSRQSPPCMDELYSLNNETEHHFGDFDTPLLNNAKQIVVNPGIAIATPEIAFAQKSGVEVLGDIELFCRAVPATKPLIAITGSNGKTTVTTLLDLMAKKSDINVGTGGNIGTPALDLLTEINTELFILELSSYQLETTPSLQTLASVILNISEDHLDRYNNDIEEYAQAKSLIYKNSQYVIYNREDAYSTSFAIDALNKKDAVSFGLDAPETGHYGIKTKDNVEWLAKGEELLMRVSDVKQVGKHNLANSLAALALGDIAGLKMSAMLSVLHEFSGMEHRTQWISEIDHLSFYNDSKGTNVGATLSALSGLSGKTVLIAGGQGKGADFLPLANVIKDKARAVVLIGEDAEKIAAIVDASIPCVFADTMQSAVKQAYDLGDKEAADNVLLSPACASFDMFDNYIQRGEVFIEAVKNLEHLQKGGQDD